jgi:Terminase large subunit, T4likevirus-type, N-terminal
VKLTFDDDEPIRADAAVVRLIPDAAQFARMRLGFAPDARQEELLRCEAKQGILNCSRQWGKSTMAAIKAVHRAYFHPKSLVVVASPTERQSAEFVLKAKGMLMQLGVRVRGDGHNRISLKLPNGSRIVGLPGTEGTVRGFSAVSLLIIDEASRVRDELYKGLLPMLMVADGDVWLLSTPWGQRGFFYEMWEHGGEDWARFRVPATECGRLPAALLERHRRQMGEAWFRQEYLCDFVATEDQMFDAGMVDEMVEPGGGWRL